MLFFHDLFFLGVGLVVDAAFVFFRQLLHMFLGLIPIILRHQFVFLRLIGVFVGVAADVADRDTGLFSEFLDP